MLGFMVPVLLSLAATARAYHREYPHQSAASEAQIRFAIENRYDDTGPGAKEPQYAYHTYKNLDDALIAYLEDPDTKLPAHERNRAINKLQSNYNGNQGEELPRYYPKTVEEYTGYNKQPKQKPQFQLTKLNNPKTHFGFRGNLEKGAEPYRLQRIQPVRENPVSVAHYSRGPEQFYAYPKYTFSYGIDAPDTGDHKSALETRDGENVQGYYSFTDADGYIRTVRYAADDKQGFQASVERTESTSQQ